METHKQIKAIQTLFAGEWAGDERHGEGKYTYVNGDVYDGEWRHGRKHGTGTYTFAATGSHYYGQWKHGRQLGYGELVHSNHKYYGRFKNSQVANASVVVVVVIIVMELLS